jgi:membrane carboxypeptidase/penicillin-binding protein
MQEDGAITAEQMKQALTRLPPLVPHERPRRETGFYFVDHLTREAKALAGIENLTASSYTVRSTVVPELQRAVEAALQEGLARYELNTRRLVFQGPEANLAEAIARLEAERKAPREEPAWQQALRAVRLPLYDVHWPIAVVLEKTRENRNEVVRVGLLDGRILPLTVWSNTIRNALQVHDVVYVTVIEAKGRAPARAELRVRPTVQGAAVAIENRTGRILAMSGGFSYPLSQLNRVTQAQRQPGSSLKPLTFLAALGAGLQPNTLVLDAPMTFPPIGNPLYAQAKDYWTPKNYDGGASGYVTLRYGLEHSKNLVTARLLDGGVAALPEDSLDRICALAMEVQLYPDCVRYYPFILGAQPVRLIDLVTFYATIANEGMRPTPYAIESVMRGNDYVYRAKPGALTRIGSADGVAFYQLKTILQGVLERGTGRSIRHLAPFVAGKTGTSDNENDAWFVGFTNDVTVGVWVGFDNADGKRRTLGPGQTGSRVAIPIFAPIMNAVWEHVAPRVALGPPSPGTRVRLAAIPVDARTGEQLPPGSPNAVIEYFRLDGAGEVAGTQYRLAQRHGIYTEHEGNSFGERLFNGGLFFGFPFFQSRGDHFAPPGSNAAETAPRGRYRPDPDYFH